MESYQLFKQQIDIFVKDVNHIKQPDVIYAKIKASDELSIAAINYFLQVKNADLLTFQLNKLVSYQFDNMALSIEDRVFNAFITKLLIQISLRQFLKLKSEFDIISQEIISLSYEKLQFKDFLVDATKLLASSTPSIDLESQRNFYNVLKLFMISYPALIERYFLPEILNENEDKKNRYSQPNKYKHKQHLENLLRQLVTDILNDDIKHLNQQYLTRWLKIIQETLRDNGYIPSNVITDFLKDYASLNLDASDKLKILKQAGFEFDMPEGGLMQNMIPYYAMIGFDAHENTISTLKELTHTSLDTIYRPIIKARQLDINHICPPFILLSDEKELDFFSSYNLNILKFILKNQKTLLKASMPDLFFNMLVAIDTIIHGINDFQIISDEIDAFAPKNMQDEKYKDFFELFKLIMQDSDFCQLDPNNACVLHMVFLVKPDYFFYIFNSGSSLNDGQENQLLIATEVNNIVSSDLKKFSKIHEKNIKNEFYRELFDLFSPHSKVLNEIAGIHQTTDLESSLLKSKI